MNSTSRKHSSNTVRAWLGLTAAGIALLAFAPSSHAFVYDTLLVSRADGPAGAGGDADSRYPSISADGRYVAFESDADNLSNDDNNGVTNVFVRDLVDGETELVSRASGAGGTVANNNAIEPSISGDGRYVAFATSTGNESIFDARAAGNGVQVYVRDLQAKTTTLVSVPTSGDAPVDSANNPSISADGRYVAFESYSNNFSDDDNDAVKNVFVHDTQDGTTALVSRADGAAGAGADADAREPAISADGTSIAFESGADNLSGEDNNAVINVFVRDRVADTTALASRANGAGGAGANGTSGGPSISQNGSRVAFYSSASNLTGELPPNTQVFVRDLGAGTTIVASRASGAAGALAEDGAGTHPEISADGNSVVFTSGADGLDPTVPPWTDETSGDRPYIRDLAAQTTALVARATGEGGAPANTGSDSDRVTISADGSEVAFSSAATNLSDADGPFEDIFRRTLAGAAAPVGDPDQDQTPDQPDTSTDESSGEADSQPPADPPGAVNLAAGKPKLKGNQLVFKVGCEAGGPDCNGTLVVKTAKPVPSSARSGPAARSTKRKKRRLVLARGSFAVSAGESVAVRARLTPKGKRLLKRRRSPKAIAIVTTRGEDGTTSTSKETLKAVARS